MVRLFEMFSGYGGASFALKKAQINYKTIGYSEIDKMAIKCYDNNFPSIKNFGDCNKINPLNFQSNDLSKNFEYLNTGKKIVHYNFNSSKQRRCINSIIENCDVLIHSSNFTSAQNFDFNLFTN